MTTANDDDNDDDDDNIQGYGDNSGDSKRFRSGSNKVKKKNLGHIGQILYKILKEFSK